MSFDELQAAWQAQSHGPRVTLDTDVLLKEVRRNQRQFETTIFWRDLREIVVAAGLTVFFLYGATRKGDLSLYLLAAGCFFVGTFMLVDRWIQRRHKPATDDPLQACIQASLGEVNHQIWLLRNILWWYILPIAVGLGSAVVSMMWGVRDIGWPAYLMVSLYAVLCGLVCWGVYWLNMLAVKRHLGPRREELEGLLESLKQ